MNISNKTKRMLIAFFLLLILLLLFFPFKGYASDRKEITLSSKTDLSGKGYLWDASKMTLTFTNANVKDTIFVTPKTGNVTVKLTGENQLYGSIHAGSRDCGDLTFIGDGTGSLTIYGNIAYSAPGDINIKNCILEVDAAGREYSGFAIFDGATGSFNVTNGAKLILTEGLNCGSDLNIDHSAVYVKNTFLAYTCVDVNDDISITNQGELHVNMTTTKQEPIALRGRLYADESSVIEVTTTGDSCFFLEGHEEDVIRPKVKILSKAISLHCAESLFQGPVLQSEPDLTQNPVFVLNPAISENYVTKLWLHRPESTNYMMANLFQAENLTKPVNEITYQSEKYLQEQEALCQAVQAQTIKLHSSLTNKKNVQLHWSSSKDVEMDYYEVYRSTYRYKGYTSTPFYTTKYGLKNYYTNTKDLKKGTRYYYKVRGVKVIDGKEYYTAWSNKAWRTV